MTKPKITDADWNLAHKVITEGGSTGNFDPRAIINWQERIATVLAKEMQPEREAANLLKEVLMRIEKGCSFPENDVQKAIRDEARKALKQAKEAGI